MLSQQSRKLGTAAVWRQLVRNFATGEKPVFDKILIANRGEIAVRVIKTARKMGIKTVAIYSEPDFDTMHVKMADEAYCVGPAASTQSYLNVAKIMEIIEKTGAQAVHPGYGFLSENHKFAEALEAKGVAFIGPGSFAITAMGDKITSKELAVKAGVSTVPGDLAIVKTDEDIKKIANHIGYPVMIKASAGGGGKGMRIAWNDKEALEGFRLSTEEAKSAFGDDRIFIEKFVEEPRHIEIQIIADSHGNVVALPERECSIQRRNQKVLEESPSSFIDPETRKKMQEEAVMLAKAVQYKSAGTVEFLVDKDKNFYFLEMNTRLQVEHPVTEYVTGLDLVELMIKVAAGQTLPDYLLKGPLPILGWAHEARVYAEDPFRGFLPSTGRLIEYVEPTEDIVPSVRVDTGVSQGSEISMFYDPMISKLITHGETREEALDRLQLALNNYAIKGLQHNLNFLLDCTRHPRFKSGNITTKFIEEEYPEGFNGVVLNDVETKNLAAIAFLMENQRLTTNRATSGKIKATKIPDQLVVKIDDVAYGASYGDNNDVVLTDLQSGEKVGSYAIESFDFTLGKPIVRGTLNNELQVAQFLDRLPQGFKLQYAGAIKNVSIQTPLEHELSRHMLEKPEVDYSKWLRSPMPGALVSIAVKEGDKVFAGQELAVVEAMKMQNVLKAEKNGTIKKLLVKPGKALGLDEEILEFED